MKNQEVPYRIEKKDGFRVIGYQIETTNQKKAGRSAIPALWAAMEAKKADLLAQSNETVQGLLGINIYNVNAQDARIFHYMIAVASDQAEADQQVAYDVPAMTWAVFPCTIETIGKTEAQAITKWLPKSNYKVLNKGYITGRMKSQAPDIERYFSDGQVEVWVAVEEK